MTYRFNMKIQAVNGTLVVDTVPPEKEKTSGLDLSTSTDHRDTRITSSVVISSPEGSQFNEGDEVFYNKGALQKFMKEGKHFGVIKEAQVFSVIRN